MTDHRRNRLRWRPWMPMLAFVCVACPQRTAIWVMPGSSAEHLVFGVSDEIGGAQSVDFTLLHVYRCDGQSMGPAGTVWMVEPVRNRSPYPTRIAYGETPEGYRTSAGPVPLTAGCYYARIVGTGQTKFLVREDGSVVESPPTSLDRH